MDRDHHGHFTQKLHKLEYVVPPLDGLGQGAISDITRGWRVGVEWGGGEGIRMVRRGARALARRGGLPLACTFASKISGAVGKNTWSAQKSGVQKHTPGDHHESAVNKDSLFGVYFCTPAVCISAHQISGGSAKKMRGPGNLERPMTSFWCARCESSCSARQLFLERSRA